MKTTGIFSVHSVEIEAKVGESFKLIPFGDVHRDSDMHADTHWKEFLAYAKRHKDKAYFLGMGDFCDGVSTSERRILGDLHDTTKVTMKDYYKGVVKTLANELSFMRGRTIGLLGGNHYWDFGDGSTTDHVLAHALDTRFLGVCSLIRVTVRLRGSGDRSMAFDIFAHHGKGGGNTPGSTFNTLEKMQQAADADFYFMGHDHKKGTVQSSPRLRIMMKQAGKPFVRERTPWLGRTGSFLKAYEDGRVSYNVDEGRPPCALGWIEYDITPTRVRNNGFDLMEFRIRGTS